MGDNLQPAFDPFRQGLDARDLFAGGFVCINVPIAMLGYIGAALESLMYPEVWRGEDSDRILAMRQVETWVAELGNARQFCEGEPCNGSQSGDNGQNGDNIYTMVGFEALESECEMSGCSIPYGALRYENGILQYLYCGVWHNVEGAPGRGGIEDPIYEPPPDVDYDETGIYPCGMATAASNLIQELAGYIWDESDNTFPVYLIYKAQNHIGLDLNNDNTLLAANQALIMKGSVLITGGILVDLERSDVISDEFFELLTCRLFGIIGSDGSADRTEIYEMCKATVKEFFPINTSGNNIFCQNYYTYILAALGSGNIMDVLQSGQFTNSGDCACPEGPSYQDIIGPTASGWYLSEPYSEVDVMPDGFDYGFITRLEVVQHHVYGVMFKWEHISGQPSNRLKRSNDPEYTTGYDVYMFGSNSESLGFNNEYCQIDNIAYAQLAPLLTLPVQSTMSGKQSDVINTPVASQGARVQSTLAGQCQSGGTGEMTVRGTIRLLHNITDNSH